MTAARDDERAAKRRDRWARPFFRQYWRALLLALVLGIATFVFASGLMVTSGYLIAGSAAVETVLLLNVPLLLVRVFGLGKPLLQYCERLASHDWVLRMTSGMRKKLYGALERTALRPEAKRRAGDVLGLLSDDIGHMQDLYLRVVFPSVVAWVLYVAIVAILGSLSAWTGLAMLLILGVVVFAMPLVSALSERARQMQREERRASLYDGLVDDVLGVADWVYSGRGGECLERHEEEQAALHALERRSDASARIRDVVMQALFGLVVVVLLCWSATAFGGGEGDPNWIAAFALGFFPLIEAFSPVPEAAVDSLSHRNSLHRLNGLPDDEEEPAAPSREPAAPYDVVLSDVRYRHEGSPREVLAGVSLEIPQGEKLAVLGRSGAGKSTLLSLIRGDFAPERGSATLGGVPCTELREEMHRYIGVIQQDSYLFNESLLENVRLGAPGATEDEVMEALSAVGLEDLARRLPDGLSTVVDEGGTCFSGGERHRIAIARVLLQDVPVVMLDEPMVGLDPVCERELLDTLFRVLEGKTLVMVTHHLQGVSRMDDVIFLEDGAIALHGSPEELEETSPWYRELKAFDRGV